MFKVIKKCKSSLERQVQEAVRIQMRGNVLNKQGLYNRCKLTRLVVDEEWDKKVWKDSWAPRVIEIDEECIRAGEEKGRKRGSDKGSQKRRRMDKLRRADPVSRVHGSAAKEPDVRGRGEGDIQPGGSQAHGVKPDHQECQDGPQEPDDQDHVPGAREGREGVHQGGQHDDREDQSSRDQGDGRHGEY